MCVWSAQEGEWRVRKDCGCKHKRGEAVFDYCPQHKKDLEEEEEEPRVSLPFFSLSHLPRSLAQGLQAGALPRLLSR